MATLANLNVLVSADTKGLTRGLKEADRHTRSFASRGAKGMAGFSKSTTGAVKQIMGLKSAIAVLAGSAGIGLLVARQLDAIDSTAKFADMIGEGTKELTGLQHAAEITAGVTDTQFNQALQRMTRRVAEAANGTGEAKDAIAQLGLDAAELNRMGPAAAFEAISGAMQNVTNQGERVRLAFKLFDSEGAKLVNTLSAGPDEIRRLVEEADSLGKSFDRVDAAKVEAANDAIARSKAAFEGVATTLTVELAPYIEAVADYFAEAAVESNGWGAQIVSAVESIAIGVGYLGNIIRGIQVVFKGVQVVFSAVAVAILQQFDFVIGTIDRTLAKLPYVGDQFGGVGNAITDALQSSKDSLDTLKVEFDELALKPLPKENIVAFFDEIKANAQTAAEQVAESRSRIVADVAGGGMSEEDQEKLEEKLQILKDQYASENQLAYQAYMERLEVLDELEANRIGTEDERRELRLQAAMEYEDRLTDIEAKAADARTKVKKQEEDAKNKLQSIYGKAGVKLAEKFGMEGFESSKIIGAGQALVATLQGQAEALKLPFPSNLAAAAAVGVAGFGFISAIKSAQIGGGGGGGGGKSATLPGAAPASSTNVPVPEQADQDQRRPQQSVNVYMEEGAIVDGRKMVEMINEALDDGVTLNAVFS